MYSESTSKKHWTKTQAQILVLVIFRYVSSGTSGSFSAPICKMKRLVLITSKFPSILQIKKFVKPEKGWCFPRKKVPSFFSPFKKASP